MSQVVATEHHHPRHVALHHDPAAAALAVAQVEAEEARRAKQQKRLQAHLYTAGRLLLSGVFIAAAVAKALRFEATRDALAAAAVSAPSAVLTVAIGVELVGGLLIALGLKTRRAALTLCAYLVVVSLFLLVSDSSLAGVGNALTNLAFVGGLLMLAAHGAGRGSLDWRLTQGRSGTR